MTDTRRSTAASPVLKGVIASLRGIPSRECKQVTAEIELLDAEAGSIVGKCLACGARRAWMSARSCAKSPTRS